MEILLSIAIVGLVVVTVVNSVISYKEKIQLVKITKAKSIEEVLMVDAPKPVEEEESQVVDISEMPDLPIGNKM